MHTIRLRKPWTRTIDEGQPTQKIDVPDVVASGWDVATSVTYRRTFNRPTGIERASVRLRITQWDGSLSKLLMNGCEIAIDPDQSSVDTDVTDSLQKHNELTVMIRPTPDGSARLTGEVSLVIVE